MKQKKEAKKGEGQFIDIGVEAEAGAVIGAIASAKAVWQLGTPFDWQNIDGVLSFDYGYIGASAQASISVVGSVEATWAIVETVK